MTVFSEAPLRSPRTHARTHVVPIVLGGIAAACAVALVAYLLWPTWGAVEWLRSITRLPVVLKGIVTPEDAALAVEHGVDAVIVSNHGGRQLDSAEPTLLALPRVADAVAGRIPVLMDGGIRRGTDVVKALALGARAVLVGRPVLWGLAVDGQAGVERVLEMLRGELRRTLALLGRPSLAALDGGAITEIDGLVLPPR